MCIDDQFEDQKAKFLKLRISLCIQLSNKRVGWGGVDFFFILLLHEKVQTWVTKAKKYINRAAHLLGN